MAAVWNYSPRQLRVFHELLSKRRRREMAEYVSAMQLATRGNKKEIERQISKWLAG